MKPTNDRQPQRSVTSGGSGKKEENVKAPAENRSGTTSHAPVVRIDTPPPKTPIFDTHYFLTSLTHIFVALASLGFAIYMIVQLISDLTPTVTTTSATVVSESEYEAATAYLLRDEQVLTSDNTGAIINLIPDGGRAGVNEAVVSIYPDEDAQTADRIAELDREIALLEAAEKKSSAGEGLPDVKAAVSDTYSSLMTSLACRDFGAAADTSGTLRRLLIRSDIYRGKISGVASATAALRTERSSLVSHLGNVLETVRASSVGYYFRYCDGYEQSFTSALIEDFTCEGFYAALSADPVIPTTAVGKLVNGAKWYIIVPLERENDTYYVQGNEYNVQFTDSGGTVVPMILEKKIADTQSGGTLLLLSTQTMPEGFNYLRSLSVKLERTVYRGYRVPMSAVRSYNGMTGVYTLHGGRVYFRKIRIMLQNDDYCIVSEYSAVGQDIPPTYKVLGFNADGLLGDYVSLHRYAAKKGWERRNYDNGGTPVKYGTKEDYYYYLDELEDIILTGRNLYDGKALG